MVLTEREQSPQRTEQPMQSYTCAVEHSSTPAETTASLTSRSLMTLQEQMIILRMPFRIGIV
jgi:hypothetical protein